MKKSAPAQNPSEIEARAMEEATAILAGASAPKKPARKKKAANAAAVSADLSGKPDVSAMSDRPELPKMPGNDLPNDTADALPDALANDLANDLANYTPNDLPISGDGPELKNEISRRHREEWARFREQIFYPAISEKNEAGVKLAKAIADVYKITQEGERKAYGFGDGEVEGGVSIAWSE